MISWGLSVLLSLGVDIWVGRFGRTSGCVSVDDIGCAPNRNDIRSSRGVRVELSSVEGLFVLSDSIARKKWFSFIAM